MLGSEERYLNDLHLVMDRNVNLVYVQRIMVQHVDWCMS